MEYLIELRLVRIHDFSYTLRQKLRKERKRKMWLIGQTFINWHNWTSSIGDKLESIITDRAQRKGACVAQNADYYRPLMTPTPCLDPNASCWEINSMSAAKCVSLLSAIFPSQWASRSIYLRSAAAAAVAVHTPARPPCSPATRKCDLSAIMRINISASRATRFRSSAVARLYEREISSG